MNSPNANQPALFPQSFATHSQSDPLSSRTPASNDRRKLIKQVFEKADEAFIARYTEYLMTWGGLQADFIAGEVTAFYERFNNKLSSREKKQLGGLYIALQKERVIEKTGQYRKRDQGNAAAVYRLKG